MDKYRRKNGEILLATHLVVMICPRIRGSRFSIARIVPLNRFLVKSSSSFGRIERTFTELHNKSMGSPQMNLGVFFEVKEDCRNELQ